MDTGRWRVAMRWGFALLLTAGAARYVASHGWNVRTAWVLALGALLPVAYIWNEMARQRGGWRFAILITVFLVLIFVAPSFAWCAVPLFFLDLYHLSEPAIWTLAGLLATADIVAQVRLADEFDLSLVLSPAGIAVVTTVVLLELRRQNLARQQAEREAGTLGERGRLSREIHDTLAQGLSSMNLLLQAADRDWDSNPQQAQQLVRQAAGAARTNLAEARRFVRGLASPELDGATLAQALQRVCRATQRDVGHPVRFQVHGDPLPLGVETEVTLLRVAQSALANVSAHARAKHTSVTLTYGEGEVMLDVFDDGEGFDPQRSAEDHAGFGLRGMRERVNALGGTLVVESAPGEGTALAVNLPIGRQP